MKSLDEIFNTGTTIKPKKKSLADIFNGTGSGNLQSSDHNNAVSTAVDNVWEKIKGSFLGKDLTASSSPVLARPLTTNTDYVKNLKNDSIHQLPFTQSAKDILEKTAINVGKLKKGIGAETTIGPNPTVTVQKNAGSQSDKITLNHELFNTLFSHDKIDPAAFNKAFEEAKNDPNNGAFLNTVDSQLKASDNSAAYEGNGESVAQDPYMLASERFANIGKTLGADGIDAIPDNLKPFYQKYLDNYETRDTQTISQGAPQTSFQKLVQPIKTKLQQWDILPGDNATKAKDMNNYVITKLLNENPQEKVKAGIDTSQQVDENYVNANFDDITKKLGLRTLPNNQEVATAAMTALLFASGAGEVAEGGKILPFLVKNAKGLAYFTGVDVIVNTIDKKIHFSENLGDTGKALFDLAKFYGEGQLLNPIMKVDSAIAEKLTKNIITKYKLPETIYLDGKGVFDAIAKGEGWASDAITQLAKTEDLTRGEFLNKYGMGKNAPGVTIAMPSERIITLQDKPYWEKIKKFFGFEPTNEVISASDRIPTQAPRGLIEAPKTPEDMTALIKETADQVRNTPQSKKPLQEIFSQPVVKENLSAEDVIKHVDTLDRSVDTTFTAEADRGILPKTKSQILQSKQYVQSDISINDLIDRDKNLAEYVSANEQRYSHPTANGFIEGQKPNKNAPIVIGKDGNVIDGMNRILTLKNEGVDTIKAYVASDFYNKKVDQTEDMGRMIVGDEDVIKRLQQKSDILDMKKQLASERQPYISNDQKDTDTVPRGLENFIARLRSDTAFALSADRQLDQATIHDMALNYEALKDKVLLGIPREQVDTISRFMDDIGARFFDDIGISIRKNGGKQGQYNWANDILTIFKKDIVQSGGDFSRVTIHELWHSLSRYLPAEMVAKVNATYEKELGKYIKENPWFKDIMDEGWILDKKQYDDLLEKYPDQKAHIEEQFKTVPTFSNGTRYQFEFTDENYRYKNLDEWFAETSTDASIDRFKDMDAETKSIFAYIKNLIKSFIRSIQDMFGIKKARSIVEDFTKGKFEDIQRQGNLRKSADEVNLMENKKTPEEILAEAEGKAAHLGANAEMPKTGPISIAQAKDVAKNAVNIDDFEAILKGGEDAIQPFYEEGVPVSITNKYYDQVIEEMRAKGYTSLSDFYYKENAPAQEMAPKVEKPPLKAPKIGVSNAEVPLNEADTEKIALFGEMKNILKDQMDSHPGKKLQAFLSRNEGIFQDFKNPDNAKTPSERKAIEERNARIVKSAENVMQNAGIDTTGLSFDDPDVIREQIADYQKIREDYNSTVEQEKEFKNEVKEQQNMLKDERALQKLSDKNQTLLEKQAVTEQQRLRKETLKRNIEERERKLLEIQKGIRDRAAKITQEQNTQLPPPLNLWQKIESEFRPLKYLDDETKTIFKKWKSDNIVAYLDGKAESKKLANIPADKGLDTILDYQAGKSKYQAEIKKVFDDLYDLAEKEMGYNIPDELARPDREGFLDLSEAKLKELGYIKDYLPQVWADSTDQLKNAVQKFMESKGLSPEQIKDYLDGKTLNTETAARLKLTPRFEKERVFPSYEVGMQHGLTPKYSHPAQLAGWYVEELRKAQANRKFLGSLQDQGKIMPPSEAPSGWKTIEAPFMRQEVFKAPPRLAKIFNGLFRDEENLGIGQTLLKGLGKISGTAQDIILTSGVPYTQINSFSLGTAVLDLTRGDVNSAAAIVRSNSDAISRKFFEDHSQDIYRMARQGIDVGKTVDGFEHAWKVNRADPQFYNKFIHTVGDAGNKAFTAKIFNSYIPQVMIQIYSDAYSRLLKAGVSEADAERQAADILRTTRAISENESFRSKGLQDFMKAFFFAPRYREAMIKVYGNMLKSVSTKARDPKYRNMRKLFLGAIITYALYNYWNYKNTGDFMWQNEPGHEFDLKFERPDGTYVYTPFLGSTSAVIRNLASGAVAAVKGDLKTAGQKFGSLFSVPVKTIAEIFSNRDYFGNQIYKDTDTAGTKAIEIAKYIGVAVNHPYIAQLMKYLAGKEPGYQALSYALELPIKFSSQAKEATKEFYNEQDRLTKERARLREQISPIYDQAKILGIGTPAANTYVNQQITALPEEQQALAYDVYKSIKTADKTANTKARTQQMYGIVKAAKELGFGTTAANSYIQSQILDEDDYKIYLKVKAKYFPNESGAQ